MSLEPLAPALSVLGLPRLLEVSHVAHRLSVSQDFVRRLIRDKKLAAIPIGRRWRIDPVDLQAFLDQQRAQARGERHEGRPHGRTGPHRHDDSNVHPLAHALNR